MARSKGDRHVGFLRVCSTIFWLGTCLNGAYGMKMLNLVVPEVIQYGVQDTVILDCDYDYEHDTKGLVIKWFFNDVSKLVYQWIAGRKPQSVGILRNRVDLTYKASNDPFTMYRAIKIIKIDTVLTGNYQCVASTFRAEDARNKTMIVFAQEKNFRLTQRKRDDDTVDIICEADGAFPAPNLTIATRNRILDGVSHNVTMSQDERFSAVASITLRDEDLPSPAEFICTLRIIEAQYIIRKETVYYPGPISTTPETPTAADMQLGAGVGTKGPNLITAVTVISLPALAFVLTM